MMTSFEDKEDPQYFSEVYNYCVQRNLAHAFNQPFTLDERLEKLCEEYFGEDESEEEEEINETPDQYHERTCHGCNYCLCVGY
jgi:hypothetical protein